MLTAQQQEFEFVGLLQFGMDELLPGMDAEVRRFFFRVFGSAMRCQQGFHLLVFQLHQGGFGEEFHAFKNVQKKAKLVLFFIPGFLNLQFLPGRCAILLPFEYIFRAALDHDLGGAVHDIAIEEVTADGFARTVADAYVQVRAIH